MGDEQPVGEIYEQIYPNVNWRSPIVVEFRGLGKTRRKRWACRVCIAREGLHSQSRCLFESVEDAQAHIPSHFEQPAVA